MSPPAAGSIVRIVVALGAVPPPDDELDAMAAFLLRPLLEG